MARSGFIHSMLFFLGVVTSASVVAQIPFQRLDILAGDFSGLPDQTATDGPEFGFSVAISGSWMAVGAPATNLNDGRRGAVFLFKNQGDDWELVQRIEPTSVEAPGSDPRCGHSVALTGSRLAIGCPHAGLLFSPDNENGTTLIYYRNSADEWGYQVAFSGQSTGERCGTAVSIATTPITLPATATAVSGCPQYNSALGRVRVYSFDGSDWSFNTAITSSDGSSGDTFGAAVSLHRSCSFLPTPSCLTRLAVGAPTKQHGSSILAGSAYVFDGSWNQTHSFTHLSPGSFGLTLFGIAVDINATQLIIGSSGGLTADCPNTPNVPRCGLARHWEFDSGGWNVAGVATASNVGGQPPGEQQSMAFGRAVALGFDNWIGVAAPFADGLNAFESQVEDLGMVELRRNDSGEWSAGHYQGELRPVPGISSQTGSHFGTSIAFGGGRWLAVGYPRARIGAFPGARLGQVWMHAEPDGIFADRFEE